MTNGIIVIDKPTGITSHRVISKLRRLLDEKKIGHCGTLDPMASGILPVMIGTAVKASEYLVDHDKRYIAGIKLGISTDTEDITGNVIAEYDGPLPSFDEFSAAAQSFVGSIMQVPPMYSALKVGGMKLVNLARSGVTVEREARNVKIYSCIPSETEEGLFLDVRCSRGTYIRTLCADIGEKLGCRACMSSLDRLEVGSFGKEDAIAFDLLDSMTKDEIEKRIIPIEKMFLYLPEIRLEPFYERLYKNGEKVKLSKLKGLSGEKGTLWRVYDENRFHSLGEITRIDGIEYFFMKKLF